jgi:uncharacterized protein YbcI
VTDATTTATPSAASELSDEISKAIGSVWAHYARGTRPSGVQTEITGNVVRCVLTGAVDDFEKGMAAPPPEDEPADARKRSTNAYKLDATSAVRRLTHRRVNAFITKHDAKTDTATEVFILDTSRK